MKFPNKVKGRISIHRKCDYQKFFCDFLDSSCPRIFCQLGQNICWNQGILIDFSEVPWDL